MTPDVNDTSGTVRERRRKLCPECMARGTLQGIGGSNWMECSNGHSWGYRERDTGNERAEGSR